MTYRDGTWLQAVGDLIRSSGVTAVDHPTTDDLWFAALRLGVTVDELFEAADLRVRYCLATVQN